MGVGDAVCQTTPAEIRNGLQYLFKISEALRMIRKMKGNVTVRVIFMHQPNGLDESGVMSRNCRYIWNIYFVRVHDGSEI